MEEAYHQCKGSKNKPTDLRLLKAERFTLNYCQAYTRFKTVPFIFSRAAYSSITKGPSNYSVMLVVKIQHLIRIFSILSLLLFFFIYPYLFYLFTYLLIYLFISLETLYLIIISNKDRY